jgi:hypothetical protein
MPRGKRPSRAVYLFTAIPWIFLGLLGAGEVTSLATFVRVPFFWLVAMVIAACGVQCIRPNWIAWFIVFAGTTGTTALYAGAALFDVVRLIRGDRPDILSDFDDSAVFLGLLGLLILVVVWLWSSRPHSPHAPAPPTAPLA